MGHYWSEIHTPTPGEDYVEAVRRSTQELGYSEAGIEFHSYYVCQHCGGLVAKLLIHMSCCPGDSPWFEVSKQIALVQQMLSSLNEPIERMQLLQLAIENAITAFAFDSALTQMCDRKLGTNGLTLQRPPWQSFEDTLILPPTKDVTHP